jgi:hypothetical protein
VIAQAAEICARAHEASVTWAEEKKNGEPRKGNGAAPKKDKKRVDASKTEKKTLPHPFVALSSDLKLSSRDKSAPNHGVLRAALHDPEFLRTHPQVAVDARFLRQLTLGESWALRFILTPNAGAGEA